MGIVIGRNGEMIKKIQNDAGVRIQFKTGTLPSPPTGRVPPQPSGNLSVQAVVFPQTTASVRSGSPW